MEYNQCQNYEVPEDLQEKEVICVEKDDQSGCKLVGCYYLRSDICSTYHFIQEPKLCVSDGKGRCEIKYCANTEKGNCDKFNENVSSTAGMKCIEPQDENEPNCQEVAKECEDYKYEECFHFSSMEEEFDFTVTRDAKRCFPKEDKSGCEAKRCSELNANECDRHNYIVNRYPEEEYLCLAKKDNSGCEIKTCKELSSDECGRFKNDFWKCEKDNDNDSCTKTLKQCSEISLELCGFWINDELHCILNDSKDKCINALEDEETKNQKNQEENPIDEENWGEENGIDEEKSNVNIIKLSLLSFIINILVY